MADFIPWLPAVVALIAAAAAIVASVINRGESRRGRREPTWTNLVQRVTDLEAAKSELETKIDEIEQRERRKMGAVLRILRSIASQWQTTAGPDLDPADLALIEEAIPPQWIRPLNQRKEAS